MDRDKAVELVELVRQRCTNFLIKEEYEIEEFVEGSTNSCSIFIERIDDRSRYWFRFTDWDKGDEYCRLSIGHHRKSDSILELIEVDDENSPPTLDWTYTPKKRKDGRNKERKERFIALTGSLTQKISLPEDHRSLDDFIGEIFTLVQNRNRAHGLVDSVTDEPAVVEDEREIDSTETYSATHVVNEGCFLERQEIERLLERLRTRKNLILQGPPGTGKTWLAKRLAFALIGERDERKVRAVQFHPNLSYEDFVRGWRPVGDGKLALADGVFMETLRAASANSSAKFVVVIEEINRGNPAQIFGELLTLLEADKRSPRDAVELCYPDPDGTRRPVHVPENVHVIGTMNIADRSLALVDLALRRRFAFVTLEPSLGEAWSDWVVRECGIDPEFVGELRRRITTLNDRIAADDRLGSQFQVGHSYVTPTYHLESDATRDWFRQVVETEIGPLLEEYWFDSPADAREAAQQLLEGW